MWAGTTAAQYYQLPLLNILTLSVFLLPLNTADNDMYALVLCTFISIEYANGPKGFL